MTALRWRDPRAGALTLWFVAGFVGMVFTVETPNLQRMATATPVLALATALLLDELVRRAGALFAVERLRRRGERWALAAAAALLAVLMGRELRFYFVDYAQMNRWAGWNQEGRALTLLPQGTLSTSLGESFHMVNSGWVRLLAPNAVRGGVRSPGAHLPLPEDGSRGLSFTVYPGQSHYLPWLRALYPTARAIPYAAPGESDYFTLLHVPAEEVLAGRGALATAEGRSETVALPGEPPAWAAADAPAIWTATLRLPQHGNYALRVTGGAARLWLSGQLVLETPPGASSGSVEVSLARGDHGLRLEGPASGVELESAALAPGGGAPAWQRLERRELTVSDGQPRGFAGLVQAEGLPEQRRQDNALATGRLSEMLGVANRPLSARWVALLETLQAGVYSFRLTLPAAGVLRLNGAPLLESSDINGARLEGNIMLSAGEQLLEVALMAPQPAHGSLELSWLPPAGEWQLLGPAHLRPAAPLVNPPLAAELLLNQPLDQVLDVIQ